MEGLSEFEITSTNVANSLLEYGRKQLVVAETKLVRVSSRYAFSQYLIIHEQVFSHSSFMYGILQAQTYFFCNSEQLSQCFSEEQWSRNFARILKFSHLFLGSIKGNLNLVA